MSALFSCPASELQSAISCIKNAVELRDDSHASASVLIEVASDGVSLTASNFMVWAKSTFPAQVKGQADRFSVLFSELDRVVTQSPSGAVIIVERKGTPSPIALTGSHPQSHSLTLTHRYLICQMQTVLLLRWHRLISGIYLKKRSTQRIAEICRTCDLLQKHII